MRRLRPSLAAVALLAAGCATTPAWQTTPHDVPFQSVPAPERHAVPETYEISEAWSAISYTTTGPISRGLNPGYWVTRIIGAPPALDVNAFGQVLDSTWFENRLGRRPLSPEDLARGPDRLDGPADGPLIVLGGKLEGATPGLVVEDARQDRYLIKFDPAAFPELASGAELIATKVLWAAGYHVPENYVVRFELNRLQLSPEATTSGKYGARIPLTEARVRDLIAHVNPYPDGTIRALFSKLIEGEPIGPFSYQGRRADDPNDRIPHQRRRSLRGLRLFSAWLNNVDTRDANSFDVFLPEQGYVKHYLLDFGDALGSTGTKPKYLGEGYEGLLDWPQLLQSLFTAGLWYRYWLPVKRSPYRSVGVFEAQVFDPRKWRSALPNPAFDEASMIDLYWAAALMARFDVEDLIAIVKKAQYSKPAAEAWVLRVLLQRQYATLDWVFDRVLPLDSPTVKGRAVVEMEDLAIRAALLSPDQVGYEWQLDWHRGDELVPVASGENFVPRADLTAPLEQLSASGADLEDHPFFTLHWRRSLPTPDLPAVRVHLRRLPEGLILVGVEREAR